MQCPKCRRLHTVLPDFLVPFKHYGAETIESVLDRPTGQEYDLTNDDPTEDYPCESTKQRWRKWLETNRTNIDSIVKSAYYRAHVLRENILLSCSSVLDQLRKKGCGWLSVIGRIVFNSGNYLEPANKKFCTRFAL